MPSIEQYFLFVGTAFRGGKKVQRLDQSTDPAEMFGSGTLAGQLTAAQRNAGQNWMAAAVGTSGDFDWRAALDLAMQEDIRAEAVVICTPDVATPDELQTAMIDLRNQGRFAFAMAAVRGLESGEVWADYVSTINAVTDGVAAQRVAMVPQLFGNNLGVLAGRLANESVSFADSPMRVATGPLIALGTPPIDADGQPLTMAVLAALDASRLSVPQWYADYDGMYWGDLNMLDAAGGDFQAGEHLRIVDAVCRRVRILAIKMIANRAFNRSGASQAYTKRYLSGPMREMSRSIEIGGVPFPGAIKPPGEDAVELLWTGASTLDIYITVRPISSPKAIRVAVGLDLSIEE